MTSSRGDRVRVNGRKTHFVSSGYEYRQQFTSMMLRHAYEKLYTDQGNSAILSAIQSSTRRVLDVGCGAGDNARALQARGISVEGVTISEREAESARAFCEKVHVFDLERGLPPTIEGTFDCCVCSHVLEHICFPEALLRDIRQRLAPDGYLLAAIPNLLFYKNRAKLLSGSFDYQAAGLMDDTHFRWYTFDSAQSLFRANGFAVERAWSEGSFPLFPVRRLLPQISQKIDALASKLLPGLFGYQLLFRLRAVLDLVEDVDEALPGLTSQPVEYSPQ